MALCFTTIITPLAVERKNNAVFIERALERKETPPSPSEWQLIKYNDVHVEDVEGIQIKVSTIETIKAFLDFDVELKKPLHAIVFFVPYKDNSGAAAISAKIVGVA